MLSKNALVVFVIGVVLIMLGFLLVVLSLLSNINNINIDNKTNKTRFETRFAVVGFIGPFPIGFSNDKRLLLSIMLFAFILLLIFVLFRLLS